MKISHTVILVSLCCLIYLFLSKPAMSQVGINTDGSQPDNSAILDVKSTSKGLLIPRMTHNQLEEVQDPANGMLVFCTTDNKFYVYLASTNSWKEISYGTGTITPWSCGDPVTDLRDGKSYATVQVGTQCWMAQNLNAGTLTNAGTEQSDNGITEKYCYNNDEGNCDVYGGLYQWSELMEYVTTEGTKGICMADWHVPSDTEWTLLTTFLGGEEVAGGKLKEAGLTHWLPPNLNATNESGFTGLPGGKRNIPGTFEYLNWYGYFTSSTQYDNTYAWIRTLTRWYQSADRSNAYEKTYGFSVRCLRD